VDDVSLNKKARAVSFQWRAVAVKHFASYDSGFRDSNNGRILNGNTDITDILLTKDM
jgi:hypothetical protein